MVTVCSFDSPVMTVSLSFLGGLALCDLVRPFGAARFHGDVALDDVPPGRIGRDAGTHHDARDDGGGHAPPECALQSHSPSPLVCSSFEESSFLDTSLPKNSENVNKICANRGVFGVNSPLSHRCAMPAPPKGEPLAGRSTSYWTPEA